MELSGSQELPANLSIGTSRDPLRLSLHQMVCKVAFLAEVKATLCQRTSLSGPHLIAKPIQSERYVGRLDQFGDVTAFVKGSECWASSDFAI